MTLEVILVALVAGLASGAAGGVIIGAVQAWMARGRGGGRVYSFARDPRPQPVRVRPASAKSSPGVGPFDRFSGHGKRVLALAQDEAIRQNHNYIGTEHLLAALLRDGDTIPARALTSLGADLTKVRTALEFIIGRGDRTTSPAEITLSPRTKKVVEFAGAEAIHLGRREVEPEHILLGLIDEGQGVATTALTSMGISLEEMRQAVRDTIGRGAQPPESGHIPFTPQAKKVLELSLREANQLGHSYIGTEHILLALIREGGGAAQLLAGAGVDYDRARQQVIELLHGYSEAGSATAPPPSPAPPAELMGRLTSIATRLTAIEQRLRQSPPA